MIAECRETSSLYAVYLLCLNFLQTFEPEDPAGEYYVCWDRVDEEGNIVEAGQDDKYQYSCSVCGEGMYEDEYYVCDECSDTLCEEHATCVDGQYLCPTCLDEFTDTCDDCGERHYNDDMYFDVNGRHICDDCREDHYVLCVNCEEYVHENEAIYNIDDELYYCRECAPATREE